MICPNKSIVFGSSLTPSDLVWHYYLPKRLGFVLPILPMY